QGRLGAIDTRPGDQAAEALGQGDRRQVDVEKQHACRVQDHGAVAIAREDHGGALDRALDGLQDFLSTGPAPVRVGGRERLATTNALEQPLETAGRLAAGGGAVAAPTPDGDVELSTIARPAFAGGLDPVPWDVHERSLRPMLAPAFVPGGRG